MRAKTVFEALANDDIKQEIADLKMKVMYAQGFHPEKVEIYLDRIAELEGLLPKNTQED